MGQAGPAGARHLHLLPPQHLQRKVLRRGCQRKENVWAYYGKFKGNKSRPGHVDEILSFCFVLWIKSVSWKYSCDEGYLEEFSRRIFLNTSYYYLYPQETDLILV